MSREKVSTEFDCRRISVVVHRSVSDKLAVVHSSLTRLSCLGLSLIPVKERERVSGKVSDQKRVNLCVAISPSFYIYTVIRTLYLHLRSTRAFGP